MVTILKLTFHTIILVDAINCYSCDINEKYNIDECKVFDDETPKENCPDQNYCFTLYGRLNGEADIGYHSCGQDYMVWHSGTPSIFWDTLEFLMN